jgi:hypothetical protein
MGILRDNKQTPESRLLLNMRAILGAHLSVAYIYSFRLGFRVTLLRLGPCVGFPGCNGNDHLKKSLGRTS